MDKYIEIEELGDGAFGSVTKAREIETGNIVAIKKFKKKYTNWDECKKLREVTSLVNLKHENIVKLKEMIRVDDVLYLVFEYMDKNLFELMKGRLGKKFSETQIRTIMFQTLKGLEHCHKYGFFHRDLKPENLLVAGDKIKLADFGLAREIRSIPPYTDYVATRWYRAPECALTSTNYNSPVDIWAMGAIMAELYTFKPLFPGDNQRDLLLKMCSVIGSPTSTTWNEGIQLSKKINFSFPNFPTNNVERYITDASPEAINMIKDMLTWDPNQRPSAQKLLQHPFFTNFTVNIRLGTPEIKTKIKISNNNLNYVRKSSKVLVNSSINNINEFNKSTKDIIELKQKDSANDTIKNGRTLERRGTLERTRTLERKVTLEKRKSDAESDAGNENAGNGTGIGAGVISFNTLGRNNQNKSPITLVDIGSAPSSFDKVSNIRVVEQSPIGNYKDAVMLPKNYEDKREAKNGFNYDANMIIDEEFEKDFDFNSKRPSKASVIPSSIPSNYTFASTLNKKATTNISSKPFNATSILSGANASAMSNNQVNLGNQGNHVSQSNQANQMVVNNNAYRLPATILKATPNNDPSFPNILNTNNPHKNTFEPSLIRPVLNNNSLLSSQENKFSNSMKNPGPAILKARTQADNPDFDFSPSISNQNGPSRFGNSIPSQANSNVVGTGRPQQSFIPSSENPEKIFNQSRRGFNANATTNSNSSNNNMNGPYTPYTIKGGINPSVRLSGANSSQPRLTYTQDELATNGIIGGNNNTSGLTKVTNSVEYKKSNILQDLVQENRDQRSALGRKPPGESVMIVNNNYNNIEIKNVNNIYNSSAQNDFVKKSQSHTVDPHISRSVKLTPLDPATNKGYTLLHQDNQSKINFAASAGEGALDMNLVARGGESIYNNLHNTGEYNPRRLNKVSLARPPSNLGFAHRTDEEELAQTNQGKGVETVSLENILNTASRRKTNLPHL